MFARTLLLAIPFVALAVSADPACTRTYVVQAGDYCDKISAAHNVSTYQLTAINSAKINAECSNLQVGDTLCLGHEGEDCSTTHIVQADNTCDGLYSQYSINSTILFANNPQINQDCANLYIGEVLCVAGSVGAPALPAGSTPNTAIPSAATPVQKAAKAPAASSAKPAAPVKAAESAPEDDDDLPFCDEL